MVDADVLEDDVLHKVVRGLRRILQSISSPKDGLSVIEGISRRLFGGATQFQVSGNKPTDPSLHIATVCDFDDVKPLLVQIKRLHKDDRRIRNALAPHPSDSAMEKVAAVINEYAPFIPILTLGGPFKLFWATTDVAPAV
ncbi:MAG: hypothetical protein KGJ49_06320 [Alphaproteobacteria bacterium]|nr:hypothetical protein [Alphaproteobacteria bacterium]